MSAKKDSNREPKEKLSQSVRRKLSLLELAETLARSSKSIWGGGLAGLISGKSEGRPTPSRYRLMDSLSVMAATIFILPPQWEQISMFSPKVRANNAAHKSRFLLEPRVLRSSSSSGFFGTTLFLIFA